MPMVKNKLYEFIEQKDFIELLKKLNLDFHHRQKNILFIEPYGASLSLLKRGLEKGWNIILFTADTDLRIVPKQIIDAVKLAVKIDTSNEIRMLDLIDILKDAVTFHAVIPGFEYFVPAAARVSQYLNLPGLSLNQVMHLRRKDLMRIQLQRVKFNIPPFCLMHSIKEIDEAIATLGFPLVCKPVDAAGSVNVKRVNNKSEAMQAVSRILEGEDVLWGHKLSKTVLMEQYIEGKEYSLEGVVINGIVSHFSVTEKKVFDQSEFIEIGHIVNPPLPAQMKQALEHYVEEVIAVLGANHCPFHAEIRIDRQGKPVLMEIAARLAGDKIGDLITLSREINYFDYVYAAYTGEALSLTSTLTSPVGIRFFYRPDVESYSRVQGLEITEQYQVEDIHFYYPPATPIPSFPKPLRRLGHVIIKNDNYIELCDQLNKIDACISFC